MIVLYNFVFFIRFNRIVELLNFSSSLYEFHTIISLVLSKMAGFEFLKKLHEEELYSDVAYLGNLLLTMSDRNSDLLSPLVRYQTTVLYADALYQLFQFKKAELTYYSALQQRKKMAKCPETRRSQTEFTSEAEISYRLHKCFMRQDKYQEAIGALESIPVRCRVPKVRAALAKLYSYQEKRVSARMDSKKMPNNAVENYRLLLKEMPFALDSLVGILSLGFPETELEQLIDSSPLGASVYSQLDWFTQWLKAQCALARRDVAPAAHLLKEINSQSSISNNIRVQTDLAKSYYLAGEREKAIIGLQRVHSIDSHHLIGMDILALLLFEEKRTKELESLATKLITDNPAATESWIALGYLCRSQAVQCSITSERSKKLDKALYFAYKACNNGGPQPRIEAMLMKAGVLMDLNKYAEAAQHLLEALQCDRGCFELYESLVQCKLEEGKMNEARVVARNCRDMLGHQSPRPLTLAATVLARDNNTLVEAQTMLEQAITAAPYLLNAVYLLVELYDKQGMYDKGIQLLRHQTSLHVNSKLHRLLGDFLSKTNRSMEAVDNYRAALTLEPTDGAANEAMENVELLSPPAFATPDVTGPAMAGFTHNLTMAPRRRANNRNGPSVDNSSDIIGESSFDVP